MDGTTMTTAAAQRYTKRDVLDAVAKASAIPTIRSEWKACWKCQLQLKMMLPRATTATYPTLSFLGLGCVRIVDVPSGECELCEWRAIG